MRNPKPAPEARHENVASKIVDVLSTSGLDLQHVDADTWIDAYALLKARKNRYLAGYSELALRSSTPAVSAN